jgi:hypothetical protein
VVFLRVLLGDGLEPPAAAVVGEGRGGAEADGLLAVLGGLHVQRRRGARGEFAVDRVQRVAGGRPGREAADLAGAPAGHLQELTNKLLVQKENSCSREDRLRGDRFGLPEGEERCRRRPCAPPRPVPAVLLPQDLPCSREHGGAAEQRKRRFLVDFIFSGFIVEIRHNSILPPQLFFQVREYYCSINRDFYVVLKYKDRMRYL